MQSNMKLIYDNIIANVAAAAGIMTVESWPNDVDIWLDNVRVTADRMPIAHVGVMGSNSAVDSGTDAEMLEEIKFTISVLFTYAGNNKDTMIDLRDAVISSVCSIANMTQGGYAETTQYDRWEFVAQYQEVGLLKIYITVSNRWSIA